MKKAKKAVIIIALIICAAYILNTYVLPASGLKLNLLDFNAEDVDSVRLAYMRSVTEVTEPEDIAEIIEQINGSRLIGVKFEKALFGGGDLLYELSFNMKDGNCFNVVYCNFPAKDESDSEFRDSRLLNAGGFDVNFRGSITACFDKMCEKYGVVEIPVSTS